MRVATWFTPGAVKLVRESSGMYFGGTELLSLFIESLFASRGGEVCLVSPFATEDLFTGQRLGGWRSLPHNRFSLTVVTRSEEALDGLKQTLEEWPWRRLRTKRNRKLHGKMYLLRERSGVSVGMIGSHNLTQGGLRDNLELGVFFRSLPGTPLQMVFDRCEVEVTKMVRDLEPLGGR